MELVGALGLFGVVLTITVAYARHSMRRVEAAWRQVAAERGAEYVPRSGFLRGKPMRIEETRDGVMTMLDTYTVSTGKSSQTYTRCRAHLPVAAGPRFRIYREGVMSRLGKMLGTQDVALGLDLAFDRHFMVKCDDPDATRRLLGRNVMRRMLADLPDARLQCDGVEVELVCTGLLRVPAELSACLDVVGEVAGSDIFGLAALGRVAGACRLSPVAVRVELPWTVDLSCAIEDGRALTIARGEIGRGMPPVDVAFDSAGQPTGAVPDDWRVRFSQGELLALLRGLAGGRLTVGDGRVAYRFDGVEEDETRLGQAAQLVATVARAPASGVFR